MPKLLLALDALPDEALVREGAKGSYRAEWHPRESACSWG